MQLPHTDQLSLSMEGPILVAAIDNPPHNRLNTAFLHDLQRCLPLFQAPDVRAVVFTGRGGVFSKGFDINEVRKAPHHIDSAAMREANELLTSLARLSKPSVAAIDGACLGGGLELALTCHVRVCSDKARIGLPEVSVGLVPGLGGAARLCRIVGEAKALEMMLLGDMIPARQAAAIGLVSRVFPRDEFNRKALSFVKTIIAAPTDAVSEILDMMICAREHGDSEAIRQGAEAFRRLLAARD